MTGTFSTPLNVNDNCYSSTVFPILSQKGSIAHLKLLHHKKIQHSLQAKYFEQKSGNKVEWKRTAQRNSRTARRNSTRIIPRSKITEERVDSGPRWDLACRHCRSQESGLEETLKWVFSALKIAAFAWTNHFTHLSSNRKMKRLNWVVLSDQLQLRRSVIPRWVLSCAVIQYGNCQCG